MLSFKVILGILFGLLVTTISILGVLAFCNNRVSFETARLVLRTHQVIDLMDKFSSVYKDVQLESAAFSMSRDPSFVQPYLEAREKVIPLMDSLTRLTADNPSQSARADTLRAALFELINYNNIVLDSPSLRSDFEALEKRLQQNYGYRERIRRIVENIQAAEYELLVFRERSHEESVRSFELAFSLLIAGVVVLLFLTFFSIRYNFNKREKIESELKKANELFEKLFYESPIALVISEQHSGMIVNCNQTYAGLVNYTKAELLGRTALELGILKSAEFRKKIMSAGPGDYEIDLTPRERGTISVMISTQTIMIGDVMCLLTAMLDITSHKEAELKVREALSKEIELNRLKSNFVTMASHEFRTPLTTILSSAFLLENYTAGDHKEKVGKHVSRIKGAVNLLTSILNEFLSLTKIEEGKVKPRIERFNVRENLEKLCADLRTGAKPGQELVYSHSGTELIDSDAGMIANIVNNLVSNAIKYSGSPSRIEVSCSVDDQICLRVKDQGIGISSEDQKHLFERFFRASNTGNIQGTGLGLHIMKHYLDLLGGTIRCQSDLGKGSEFVITLPADGTPEG